MAMKACGSVPPEKLVYTTFVSWFLVWVCRYVSDLHQLKNFGACLHLCNNPPAAILVDNLTQIVKNTRLVC
jgi:hypothetical protein